MAEEPIGRNPTHQSEEAKRGHPQDPVKETLDDREGLEQTEQSVDTDGFLECNSSIKEEERPILSDFVSSLTLDEKKRKLNLQKNNLNNDVTDNLSPPYSVLESSEQTSPCSSILTDSSPNEPNEENNDFGASSHFIPSQQQRAGAAATLSNVEATGMLGRMSSKEDQAGQNGSQGPLSFSHGTVIREGEMVSFVADDLMTKIRQSTSSASTSPANSNRGESFTYLFNE